MPKELLNNLLLNIFSIWKSLFGWTNLLDDYMICSKFWEQKLHFGIEGDESFPLSQNPSLSFHQYITNNTYHLHTFMYAYVYVSSIFPSLKIRSMRMSKSETTISNYKAMNHVPNCCPINHVPKCQMAFLLCQSIAETFNLYLN